MNNQRQWINDEFYFENNNRKGKVWFLPLKSWRGDTTIAYHHNTNPDVIRILHTLIESDIRVRVYYGNPETGEAYYDKSCHYSENGRIELEYGEVEEGYVDISAREVDLRTDKKASRLILMSFMRKDGYIVSYINHHGQALKEEQIVKIEFSNKRVGGVIWEHPEFHFYGERTDKRYYYDHDKEKQSILNIMKPSAKKKIA
jgi:hypothetical protein